MDVYWPGLVQRVRYTLAREQRTAHQTMPRQRAICSYSQRARSLCNKHENVI